MNMPYITSVSGAFLTIYFSPSSDFHVALYLIHLRNLGKATGSINETFYAISWAHELAGMLDPCASDLTKPDREGCSRDIGRKVYNEKLPITPDILKKLCVLYGNKSCN